ncbi:hypothetical protein CEXT_623451 [Caerostris extrusa]|uniref:Uncharacterized protein n=1 Tax=Caerostris extrusa TaxID=172846 RepID=A0AAV4NYU1_CAEEX|nr:hypothetical protein CEXT_623451 [Caerostris extrusa]
MEPKGYQINYKTSRSSPTTDSRVVFTHPRINPRRGVPSLIKCFLLRPKQKVQEAGFPRALSLHNEMAASFCSSLVHQEK